MSKNIIITGGLGYIGSVLFEVLKNELLNVSILDNHLYKEIKPRNGFIEADVRNKEQCRRILKDYDIIVNLAAIVGDPACLIDTQHAININCIGTRNIAELCSELNKSLIHISTCSIYGSEPNKIVKEEDEGFPIDFYGQTKYTQERLVREICKNDYTILRLGTAYGLSPRMRFDLVVNRFIAKAVRGEKIIVFGGQQERPFVHIRDISRAIFHVIDKNIKGIYNVRGDNLSLLDLSQIIKEKTKCKVEINKEIVDQRSYIVNNSKLIEKGFEYIYSIEDAIVEISNSETVKNMNDVQYSNLKLMESLKLSQFLKKQDIHLINGGIAVDDRGTVSFINEFNFKGVKRFYQVKNFSTSTIRAFHGHLKEGKYVYVVKGTAIVAAVKMDDIKAPSKNNEVKRYILSDKQPKILYIPPKHANGFRSLEKNTHIIFFSTSTLDESQGDDYRFPPDYWGKEVWEVEDR